MRLKWFVPGTIWFLLSTALLAWPGNALPETGWSSLVPHLDKIVHLIMFFLLTALYVLPIYRSQLDLRTRQKWFLIIALLAFAFGVAMEFVQKYLVAYRSFELVDIVFDGIGCMIAWLAAHLATQK